MNHNTTTGLYEATIPEQPIGTLVKYQITAFDKANNKSVENNSGQYFVYSVISEFTTIMFLLILIFLFNDNIDHKKKSRKTRNKSTHYSTIEVTKRLGTVHSHYGISTLYNFDFHDHNIDRGYLYKKEEKALLKLSKSSVESVQEFSPKKQSQPFLKAEPQG